MQSQESQPRRPPFFFRDDYANLIVKGNFMTLAAKPVLVEEGEWLAHQGVLPLDFPFLATLFANHQKSVVEQYRLLDGMIQIIRTPDEKTGQPICNPDVCPTMSASG
jgi:hypothetical protein